MAPKKAKQTPPKKMKKMKKATRKPARTVRKPQAASRKPVKVSAKPAKAAPKKKAKARVISKPVKKAAAKTQKKAEPSIRKPQAASRKPVKPAPLAPPPALQRERRRLPEAETESFTNATEDSRLMSSARTGHDELRSEIKQHTESSPAMTAGDLDAKWQDAYALGDEAPGGDNMTPDQDRVDDIGKALGIEYADDEELLGGDEIAERDEHRWELDPASKDEDEEI